jgi:hypothetical protein
MKIGSFLKFIVIAVYVVIFFISCEDQDNSGGDNYAISSLYAVSSSIGERTEKLIFTVNNDKLALTADDIKINATFSVIKGALTKTGTMIYELFITSGNTGTIRVGLDPYRGFTGWNAKTAYVYADWYFSGTSELTITGYSQSGVSLSIPVKIAGVPITTIGVDAFNNRQLTGVDISDNITAIRNNAFVYNQLTTLKIPQSVTFIGNTAFAYNQLTNITISEGVTYIGDNAFAYNQLSAVIIPQSVTTIGNATFAYNQLKNITISEGVEQIGDNAFAYNLLSSVTFPESVTVIGNGAFASNNLNEIIIPDYVETIGGYTFLNNQLINVTISEKVTSIGNNAFAYNNLSEITIPDNVKSIEIRAFFNNQMTKITIGENVTLGSSSFDNGFESAYNIDYNKSAGTYTFDIGSNKWIKEE